MTIHNLEISTAYFTNNERTEIEVMLFSEDSTEDNVILIPFNVEAKAGDADYDWLISKIDIDQIHENTFNKIRRENEQFRDNCIAAGKEMGLILEDLGGSLYEALIDTMFSPINQEDLREKLFLIKLKFFEQEVIKSSKDKVLKSKLRKAQDFVSAIKYAAMIASPEVEE